MATPNVLNHAIRSECASLYAPRQGMLLGVAQDKPRRLADDAQVEGPSPPYADRAMMEGNVYINVKI